MQGIQLFDYKYFLEHLRKLREADTYHFPCEHAVVIAAHEDKLKEIYQSYQLAMEDVSTIVRQFDEQKLAIRRLVNHHRNCRIVKRKGIIPDRSQLP
ncbi:hypothetical protein BH11BAC4_BH11BAC4_04580 [soil metagenome]